MRSSSFLQESGRWRFLRFVKKYTIICLLLLSVPLYAQSGGGFIRGIDISFTPQIESLGGKYLENGVQKDALDIFKENGANYVRLRLWHTPSGGWCGLGQTIQYAVRLKAKGFKFLLDIHYSDSWADPGKQNKPAAWAGLTFSALNDSVYAYTKNVISALKGQNALPDMVQIGNEITGGMLWPDGKLYGVANPDSQWIKFGQLLKSGIAGVKDAADTNKVRIMIHIDRGGDNAGSIFFYDHVIAQGVNFDVIGLSYYPWWHGNLTQLSANLHDLSKRYQKDLVVAETAYPWTLQSQNDGVGNIVGPSTTLLPGYPASPDGQKNFVVMLSQIIKDTTSGKGIGFFYWEPSYISVSPIGSPWENLTTFGFDGAALSSIKAFRDLDSLKSVSVKVRINTSTLADTLRSSGIVQVRGEVDGFGSSLLPSGDIITWDAGSQLIAKNIGGDNWEYQFKLYQGDQLNYKFWAGHNINTPAYLRLGWEGPITPFDGSAVNGRLFTAGVADTVLATEYFNSSGDYVSQYWTPFTSRKDSLGVLFRVNAASLTKNGLFDPAVNGPIVVRGDSATSAGVLSWFSDNVVLSRESTSVANGSFWSGAAYFPTTKIAKGAQIKYKFVAEKSPFGGFESGIDNRTFAFPTSDTTLAWQFFNNGIPLSVADRQNQLIPSGLQLYPNYPNPFNPQTTIRYSLSRSSLLFLGVYNILGQLVTTLRRETEDAGYHSVTWDGTTESGAHAGSGIYFVKVEAEGAVRVRTMILLK